jgi:putative membrane protein insertion efficiency factor
VNWIRTAAWRTGAPARALLIGAVRLYRLTLSGWLGGQCRYVPSCSHYAETAIRTHGAARGSALAGWRLLRCNPFGSGGFDAVPTRPMQDVGRRVTQDKAACS